MDVIVRLILLIIFLQVKIQLGHSGVEHLTQRDEKCFPYDFDYKHEERIFVRLLIIPYLDVESIRDLSRLETIPDDNMRFNEFMSCIWMDRGFQMRNGKINFDAVERALAKAIGREVGSTGPGLRLSELEAARIVGECNNLGGVTHGQKVAFVRNCVLRRIQKFGQI